MTYSARLPALSACTLVETRCDDTGQNSAVHVVVASCRPGRRHLRCRVLICYLLDVNALFDGDGTRCAVPATPRAHPSNYWRGTLGIGRKCDRHRCVYAWPALHVVSAHFQAHTHGHTVERTNCQVTLSTALPPRVTVSHPERTQLANDAGTARRRTIEQKRDPLDTRLYQAS